MKFKGDVIITDPCYILTDEDYKKSNYGSNLHECGFTIYLVANTGFGDWDNFIETENGQNLGDFCADSGQVCVVLKSEVEKYGSKLFTYADYCYATIKDFDGDIEIDTTCSAWTVVRGVGNINFHSAEPEQVDWENHNSVTSQKENNEYIKNRLKDWEDKNGSINELLKKAKSLLEENE